jgi:hypothetical protein
MIAADIGVPTPLELMLFDGQTTKGVRVFIRTTAGALVTTVNLSHVGEGLYTANWVPTSAGYYHANYVVYTNGSYTSEDFLYPRTTAVYKAATSSTPEAIAGAVWDAALVDHNNPGSFGEAISILLTSMTPEGVADAVWDALVADHRIPNTFGDWVQAIWEYSRAINDEVTHPVWGLDMIYNLIQNSSSTIDAHVLQNGTKIDALTPLIIGSTNSVIMEVEVNRTMIQQMEIQNAADLVEILNAIGVTNSKVDAVGALVGTLQNNTTARFVVPERLVKPETGTKDYQFHLRIYDTSGNPKAPDETPKIRIRRLDTGVDIVLDALMTQDGAKIGAYFYVFGISAGTDEYPALVEVTIVEDAVARYIPATTEITEFEADLNAIQAQLTTVDSKVTSTQLQLSNPVYGLSALKQGEVDILNAVSSQDVVLGQIKSKTDLIPADIATLSDINDILMQLAEKPSVPEMVSLLNNVEASIKGPDMRTLTDVYDVFDLTGVMQSNDPRLNFLDTPVSSRSVLTAADVWSYATRTLTSSQLDSLSIKAIWDYLCSQATTPGSMGKRICDMLDAQVSTRATGSEMALLLSDVAHESTLLTTRTDILNSLVDCKNKIANLTSKVLLVKAKTDNLPEDPASEGTLGTAATQIREDIADLSLVSSQIKSKTDALPPDPARQTSVLAIPTNPLRVDDARLVNLDARISTRSTLSLADLSDFARKADVLAAQNNILADNSYQTDLISNMTDDLVRIEQDTNRIPLDPATISAIVAAENAILEAISHITSGDIDPADIWSYTHRTLTQDPSTFGPDISHLATKDDVAAATVHQYTNRMTTTFNPGSSMQEVLVWAEKDGQRILAATDCQITVKDSMGTVKWVQSTTAPGPDGVFRFINPVVVTPDANYYAIMSIIVDGAVRTAHQAFITVG